MGVSYFKTTSTIILCGTVLEDDFARLVSKESFSDDFSLDNLDFDQKILMLKKLLLSMNGFVKEKKDGTTFFITIPTSCMVSMSENLTSGIERTRSLPNRKGAFIYRVRKIIETKLNDDSFGIQQFCKEVGFSRTQLHNKIKVETGLSTSIYIRSVRLDRAKFLLNQTELNVSEVAYKVGFKDPSYFSRLFKKRYNIAPSRIGAHIKFA